MYLASSVINKKQAVFKITRNALKKPRLSLRFLSMLKRIKVS